MKRLLFAGLLLAATFGGDAFAQSYQASRDFTRDNPTGVWLFGYGRTNDRGSLKPLPFKEEQDFDAFYKAFPIRKGPHPIYQRVIIGLGHNNTTVADPMYGVIAPNMLALRARRSGGSLPERYDSIVRFKAPEAGTYAFEGYYALIDDREDQAFEPLIYLGGENLSQKAFKQAGFVLFGKPADPATKTIGETKNFKFDLKLKQNAQVFFSVRQTPSFTSTSSLGVGFDVRVTPKP